MDLVVVGFQDKYRAAQVLTELRQRGVHLFDLEQAITVSWEDRRNFIVQQSINLSHEEGSHWARLWGAFIKATLFQPFTERLSEAAVKVTSRERPDKDRESPALLSGDWWVSDIGIPDDFVRDVGALVQLGESAIITLAEGFEPQVAVGVLRKRGGSLIYTSLSDEQTIKVRQELATGD
jgi:Predicted membrane protein